MKGRNFVCLLSKEERNAIHTDIMGNKDYLTYVNKQNKLKTTVLTV